MSLLTQFDLSTIDSCCDETPKFLIIYKAGNEPKETIKVCLKHIELPCFSDERVIEEKFSI
jgi:hypothetical protein